MLTLSPPPMPVVGSHGCPDRRPSCWPKSDLLREKTKRGKNAGQGDQVGPGNLSFCQPSWRGKNLKVEGSPPHCLLSHLTPPRQTHAPRNHRAPRTICSGLRPCFQAAIRHHKVTKNITGPRSNEFGERRSRLRSEPSCGNLPLCRCQLQADA